LSNMRLSSESKCEVARSLRLMLEQTEVEENEIDGIKIDECKCDKSNFTPLLHSQTLLDCYIYLPASSDGKAPKSAENASLADSPSGISSGIRLPVLKDFNKSFKRGYGVLIWIRPGVTPQISGLGYRTKDDARRDAIHEDNLGTPQTLFRIATRDSRTFLQCTLSSWDLNAETGYTTARVILSVGGASHGIPGGGSNRSVPRSKGSPSSDGAPLPIHVATGTISVPSSNGQWELLSISHSNPYLKRPRFTMTLSGDPILDAECPYPLIQDPIDSSAGQTWMNDHTYHHPGTINKSDMDDVILLNHLHIPILCGGTAVLQEPFPNEPVAVLGELGPCVPTILAHPPPVPLNRDAATVSVHPGAQHSLGMVTHTNIPRFHATRKHAATKKRQSQSSAPSLGSTSQATGSFNSTSPTSGRVQLEFARIGIPSCKEGIRGADMVQLLRSKLVYEFHPNDTPESARRRTLFKTNEPSALEHYHQRVVISPSFVCGKIGLTENVRLGLVEPNPGNFHLLQATGNVSQSNIGGMILLGDGCVISNQELIPQYWPQSQTGVPWPGESIPLTHSIIHSLSLCVLPLRLALSSLGEPYYEKDSKERMQHTQETILRGLMNNNGAMCCEILRLIGTLLRCSGEVREEAVQSGYLYVLTGLLRRVVRRAHLFNLISAPTNEQSERSVDITTTNSEMELVKKRPQASGADDSIYHVPLLIVHGALSIVSACCGGTLDHKFRTKTGGTTRASGSPDRQASSRHLSQSVPASLFLRRNSDLALQCLHGFCFQFCLWGACASNGKPITAATSNWEAASVMLSAVVSRYCPSTNTTSPNPYGTFLRNHMSAQTLLDMIQYHFSLPETYGDEFSVFVSKNKDFISSCSSSLSMILTCLLQVSLEDTSEQGFSRCDQDIEACVSCLSSSSLGSFAAGIILNSLHAILAKCSSNSPLQLFAYPDVSTQPSEVNDTNIMGSLSSPRAQQNQRDQISYRISRKLKLTEFGTVIGPMLLCRIISCGSVALENSDITTVSTSNQDTISRFTDDTHSNDTGQHERLIACLDWKIHWRRTLLLWVWLLTYQSENANSASPAGFVKACHDTCSLLLASAKTGALEGCLSLDIVYRLLPCGSERNGSFFGSKSSLGYVSMDRVQAILPLVPALVATLLIDPPDEGSGSLAKERDRSAAIVLYKLVFSLNRSVSSILETSLHQVDGKKTSEYYAGISTLSVAPPLKKLVAFTEMSTGALTKLVMLLQPYSKLHAVGSSRVDFPLLEGSICPEPEFTGKTELENYDPGVSVKLSLSPQTFDSIPDHELSDMEPDNLVQICHEFVESTLCNIMSTMIIDTSARHSADDSHADVALWKSILVALESCRGESKPLTVSAENIDHSDSKSTTTSIPQETGLLCNLCSTVLNRLCDDAEQKQSEVSKQGKGKGRSLIQSSWSTELHELPL